MRMVLLHKVAAFIWFASENKKELGCRVSLCDARQADVLQDWGREIAATWMKSLRRFAPNHGVGVLEEWY